MNELIEYVSAKGREVRMWASLGSNGFVGEAPVSTNATAHYWSQNWANYAEMIDMGYACINNCDGCLYSVPGAGYYHDYIPTWWLHDNWFVNSLSGSYNHIAESHPLLRGAEAACWYDVMAGMSEYDIFDRAKEQILVMSEKNWCGSQRVDSADQFCSRLALFGKTSPLGNPARYIASAGDVIADYDFDNISGGVLRDNSGNGYTAAIHGLDTVVSGGKNALVFNQSGYISLPFDGIGFPYSVSFDLYINEGAAPDSVLFSGEDGTLYLNYKGTGKIAYERNCSRCYPYIFDCAIEEGMWNNIQLICDKKDMSLYLNGSSAGTAKYYNAAGVKQESSTFVLPVTEIGKGVSGMMRSLTVWNRALSEDEASGVSKLGEENLALKKKVTVSGLEVQGALTGEMAVDGDPATRASLERKHDSWLYVDLGEVRTVGRIEFDWAHRPNKFNLQVSEDGQTWTVVYEDLNCAGNTEGRDVFTLPSPVRARYVKYNQIDMFRSEYGQFSGTFYEMEVYENRYSNADVIAQARELLNSTPKTAENETFLERFAQNIDLAEKVNGSGTEAETAIALRQIQAQTESLRAGDVSAKKADLSALYALLTAKEDLNLLTAQSAAAYERAYKNGLYTFMEMSASGAAADAAAEAIRSAIDGLEVCPLITVTTNKVVYQDYYLEKLIDNDQNSICWLQDEQRAGDWVQFRFRVPTALGKVRLLSAAAGSDIIGSADFQISSDGKSWKTVGKLTSQTDQSITFSEEKVLAARILLTSGKGNWLKMNEIIFNDTVLVDTARLETATRKSVD